MSNWVKSPDRALNSIPQVQRQPRDVNGKYVPLGDEIDRSFTLDNRGKRSICVDLGTEAGRALVKRLARKADVFLTNLLPSRLAKFGLDYEHIHEINPKVVYSSVSGWGLNGPSPSKLAFDMTAFFARGGVMGVLGTPGAPPVKPRSGQGDHQTGLAALSSILAALFRSRRRRRRRLSIRASGRAFDRRQARGRRGIVPTPARLYAHAACAR